jgi:threonine dehydratase
MPDNAPKVKVAAVKEYGGIITFCKPILEERESTADTIIKEYGATFIHPYNNDNVIAGQGTCGLELIDQLDFEPDIVMAPVGGGGLLSGTTISVKALTKNTKVFGAEPEMADDAYRSFAAGKIIPQTNPQTIADGLLTSLGDKTFKILNEKLDEVLLCSEASIRKAMLLIFENLKIVVEPSAAVTLACVIDNQDKFKDKMACLVLSGGNIDIAKFDWE